MNNEYHNTRSIVETGTIEIVGEYTFWESLAWHLKSRRSRLVLLAVITMILLKCQAIQGWFGIRPEDAGTMAYTILGTICYFVTIMTGEKIAMNGKPLPASSEDVFGLVEEVIKAEIHENKDKIEDKVAKKVSLLGDRIIDKLKKRFG